MKKRLMAMFLAFLMVASTIQTSNLVMAEMDESTAIELSADRYCVAKANTTVYSSQGGSGTIGVLPAGGIVLIREMGENRARIAFMSDKGREEGWVRITDLKEPSDTGNLEVLRIDYTVPDEPAAAETPEKEEMLPAGSDEVTEETTAEGQAGEDPSAERNDETPEKDPTEDAQTEQDNGEDPVVSDEDNDRVTDESGAAEEPEKPVEEQPAEGNGENAGEDAGENAAETKPEENTDEAENGKEENTEDTGSEETGEKENTEDTGSEGAGETDNEDAVSDADPGERVTEPEKTENTVEEGNPGGSAEDGSGTPVAEAAGEPEGEEKTEESTAETPAEPEEEKAGEPAGEDNTEPEKPTDTVTDGQPGASAENGTGVPAGDGKPEESTAEITAEPEEEKAGEPVEEGKTEAGPVEPEKEKAGEPAGDGKPEKNIAETPEVSDEEKTGETEGAEKTAESTDGIPAEPEEEQAGGSDDDESGEEEPAEPMMMFGLSNSASPQPDPKDLPDPPGPETKTYSVEWWDDRNATGRQNPHELKLTYYLPVVPIDGYDYGEDYVVCDKGGTKYLYKKNTDQGVVTYTLEYDKTPVTKVLNPDPSGKEKYTVTYDFERGAAGIEAEWSDYPGYTKETGDDSVLFIKNKEVTFTKIWYDENDKLNERPTVGQWIGSLSGSGALTPSADDVTVDPVDPKIWTLKATVPAYSSMTDEITYTIDEDLSRIGKKYPDNPTVGQTGYTTVQTNPLASQPSGNISTIYEDGISESTLRGLTEFKFTKNWLDNGDKEKRPAVTFYLYRYIPAIKSDMSEASPVRGMDSMALDAKSVDGSYTFTSKNQSTLERFDENGNEYVYFIMEKINGSGYQSVIKNDKGEPLSIKYMDMNGNAYIGYDHKEAGKSEGNVIYNLRVGTTGVSATKTWDALAVQALHGKVLFALQSRVKTADDSGTWEFVKVDKDKVVTQQQNGFKAEQMSMNVDMPGTYPRYDDNGAELEYRVVEAGAAVSDKEDDTPIDFNNRYYQDGECFVSDGYRFKVEYSADGSTITNRLVGYTDLMVDKTFTPGIEGAQKASMWLEIARNGGFTQTEIDALKNTPGVTVESGSAGDTKLTVKLESTPIYTPGTDASDSVSTVHVEAKNFERYDSAGREYTYTVTELSGDIDGVPYQFAHQNCDIEEVMDARDGRTEPERVRQIKNSIANGRGGGDGLRFQVGKVWQDDNDLVCRRDVVAGLYYLGDKGKTRVSEVKLTAQNGWFSDFFYPIDTTGKTDDEIAKLKDYKNYAILEESVGGSKVQDSGLSDIYTQSATTSRYTTTDSHIYLVYDEANCTAGQAPDKKERTITNTRVGELQVKIDKNWNLGDMKPGDIGGGTAADFKAVFEVKNDSGKPVDTVTVIKDATGPFLSGQLPKYDANGRVIGYTVTELSLNGVDFTSNSIDLNDYFVVSSSDPAEYKTHAYNTGAFDGKYLHTYDQIEQTFSNTRTQSADLWVNKVWRDVGIKAQRPDIVMKLWRVSTNTKTPGKEEVILNDNLWDTTINAYFWECHFGNQPLYDGEGYRYKYYVTETIPQISDYQGNQTYYNVTSDQPDRASSPAESKDVFDKFGDNTTPAYQEWKTKPGAVVGEKTAAKTLSAPGTIINTPKKNTDFIAYKRWVGHPTWLQYGNLPKVEVMLMRKLTEDATAEPVPNSTRILTSDTRYKYRSTVPVYNEYGIPYASYYLEETVPKITGYTSSNAGKDIVNTYTGDPKIKINITKTWDWTGIKKQIAGQENYPGLEFELWQKLDPPSGIASSRKEVKIGTASINGGQVNAGGTTVEPTVYFTRTDGSGSNEFELYLWMYNTDSGNNEKVYYTYWAVEKGNVTPAYEVTFSEPDTKPGNLTSDKRTINETDLTNNEYRIEVGNKYQAKGTVEATKIWSDADNVYGLRPGINDGKVTFTLWRTAPGNPAEEVKDVTAAWTQTGDPNVWKCVFTPKKGSDETLPVYTTDNQLYTYHVTEKLEAPYDKVYSEVSRKIPDLKVTNTLNTVQVYAKKNWAFKCGSDTRSWDKLDTATRARILYFAGLSTNAGTPDAELKFRVTAKDRSGAEIPIFDLKNTPVSYRDDVVPYSKWNTLCGNAGLRILTETDLPKYRIDGSNQAVEILYEVTEIKVGTADVVGGRAGCVTVTDLGTVYADGIFTGTTTNALELIKITLEKEWNDQDNREGKRPRTLSLKLRSHAARATTVEKERAESLTWADTVVPSDGNKGSAEYLLPMWNMAGNDLTYSFVETVPSGNGWTYTASVNTNNTGYQSGNTSSAVGDAGIVRFKNDYLIHKLRLNYSKEWDPKTFDYWDQAIDTPVTVQLERSEDGGQSWSEMPGYSVQLTWTKNGGWSMPVISDWVVDCYKEKSEGDRIYTSTKYSYRVVEKVNGVTHVPGESTNKGVRLSVNPKGIDGTIDGNAWEEEAVGGTKYMIRPKTGSDPLRFSMTNTLDLTSFTVTKQWKKDDGLTDQPAAVKFRVWCRAGGQEYELVRDNGDKVDLTVKANDWKDTVSNLPKYDKNGNAITYFAKETDPSPLYVATDTGKKDFTNTRKTVQLTVMKDWRKDSGNKFNTRKDLTISVYRGTADAAGAITWEASDWAKQTMVVGKTTTLTFTDLPATYLDGNDQVQPYYYKVTETPVGSMANYAATVAVDPSADAGGSGTQTGTGYTSYAYLCGKDTQSAQNVSLGKVTFTNELDTADLTVKKQWDASPVSNFDVIPDPLQIVELQWKTTAAATWTKCDYQEHSAFEGSKTWTVTYHDLPRKDGNGVHYEYRVKERSLFGFELLKMSRSDTWISVASAAPDTGDIPAITMENDAIPVTVTVRKKWEDHDDKYRTRPVSVNVELQWKTAGTGWTKVTATVPGKTYTANVTLNSGNSWSHDFTGLPIADKNDKPYSYRIVETPVPDNYTAGYSLTTFTPTRSSASGTVTVTNTLIENKLKVTKKWDDQGDAYGTRPDSIVVTLQRRLPGGVFADMKDKDNKSVMAVLSPAGWNCSFVNLPVYAPGSADPKVAYEYRVVEAYSAIVTGIPGYTLKDPKWTNVWASEGTDMTGKDPSVSMTNEQKITRIEIEKKWNDNQNKYLTRPGSVTVALEWSVDTGKQKTWTAVEKNGTPVTAVLDAAGYWKHVFDNLPVMNKDKQIYYRVRETSTVNGYTTTGLSNVITAAARTDASAQEAVITNDLEEVKLPVTKVWDDQKDKYGTRPVSLYVKLQRYEGNAWKDLKDNTGAVTAVILVPNNWKHTFEHLPKVDAAGRVWQYRAVEAFDTTGTGLTGYVMNYADAAEPWTSAGIAADAAKVEIGLKNTQKTTDIKVSKSWEADEEDRYGTRPDFVEVKLQWTTTPTKADSWADVQGNGFTAMVKLSDNNSWTHIYEDLPIADKNNDPLYYRVVEVKVPYGYKASYQPASVMAEPVKQGEAPLALKVTNTLEKGDLTITKNWDDQNNDYGKRPGSIYVKLQWNRAVRPAAAWSDVTETVGGTTGIVTVTLDDNNKWTHKFTGLPKYDPDNGNALVYRVVEAFSSSVAGLEGYTLNNAAQGENWAIDGQDLTGGAPDLKLDNKQRLTAIGVKKIWEDNNDLYATRPQTLDVTLEWSADPADENSWKPVTKETTTQGSTTPTTITLKATLDANNSWEATWTNLPIADENNESLYYRVTEVIPNGYAVSAKPAEIKAVEQTGTIVQELTNTLEEIDLPVVKEWDDQKDKYGTRPAGLYVKLQRSPDGKTWTDLTDAAGTLTAVTLDDTVSWKHTFEHLPKVDLTTGRVWQYRAVEAFDTTGTGLTGYTMNYVDALEPWTSIGVKTDTTGTFEIGLKNTQKTTDVQVSKSWEMDGEDRYGTRPDFVEVKIQWTTTPTKADSWADVQGNGFTAMVKLSDNNSWTHIYEDLPIADKNNDELYYRVVEVAVPYGYQVTYQPKFEDGVKAVPGSTLGMKVTNTLEKGDLTITKNWDDQSNDYGKRPGSVYVKLQWNRAVRPAAAWSDVTETVGGTAGIVAVTLDNGNRWTHTFTGLPAYDPENGNALIYRVTEAFSSSVSGLEGYTLTNAATGETWAIDGKDLTKGDPGLTLENKQKLTAIGVKKIWEDNNDLFATRPQTLEVTLEWNADPADGTNWKPVVKGTITQKTTLDANNSWEAVFTDLPIADENNAALYYRVMEVVPNGYTVTAKPEYVRAAEQKGTDTQKLELTNTLRETDLPVTKVWDDQTDKYGTRPVSLYVRLQRSTDGANWTDLTDAAGTLIDVTLNNANNWKHTFEHLPQVDGAGRVWQYRAVEAFDTTGTGLTGYTMNYADASESWTSAGIAADAAKVEISLKNTRKTTDIKVSKSWEADEEDRYGTRPASVDVKLQWTTTPAAPGSWTDVTGTGFAGTVKLEEKNNWTHVFEKLPIADKNNDPLYYRVVEVKVPYGYRESYQPADVMAETVRQGEAPLALKVTNTLEKGDLTITKNWDDQNNDYGKRPGSIYVKLQWNRAVRPAAAWSDVTETVGGSTGIVAVTLDNGNRWTHTFTGLPAYDPENGNALIYRVTEAFSSSVSGLEGYTLTNAATGETRAIDGKDLTKGDPGLTLENKQKLTAIGVKKIWEDNNDLFATRPQTLEVTLEWNADPAGAGDWQPVKQGTITRKATLDANNSWEAVFTDLPIADENNAALYYRVTEVVPNGYTVTAKPEYIRAAEQKGTDTQKLELTNTLMLTELTLRKTWDDQENSYQTRPAEIRAVLERSIDGNNWYPVPDGTGKQLEVTLKAAEQWQTVIKDLQAEDHVTGRAYSFRAVETVPVGYTGGIALFVNGEAEIVNTLNTVDLALEKAWADRNNQYNSRPKSLTVVLESSTDGTVWQTVKNAAGNVTLILRAENGWKGTFAKLPKTDPVTGTDYRYRVKETLPEHYKSDSTGLFIDGKAVLVNTYAGTVYNLTVEYIYVDGTTAAPTHTSVHPEGDDYQVISPVIPGYTASVLEVAGTMPAHDVSYIVIYVPENDHDMIIIDDDPTPLGLGDNNINVGDCFE